MFDPLQYGPQKSQRVARIQLELKSTTQDGVPQIVAKPAICMSMGIASLQKSALVVVSSNKPSTRAQAPMTAGTAQSRGRASIVICFRVVYWALGGAVVLFAGQPASVSYWESALCEAVVFFVGQPCRGTARRRLRGATTCEPLRVLGSSTGR